ncbi:MULTISPECIES: MFS transporter [unclassified Streptomyces]|uniref:MFS transporter n=1 Tax=unclassified Streptomyces TaxID=2593676 RepID=UPI00081F101D|nr:MULTISPECIES: MFS transporter [unclassified Streptomyces]MYR97719.1 MFS transporter [Streptomyces sp. SID4937]SCE29148.1 Nitrate/nitrite transporter NarK [Streptomyces sp. ScaeMP-e83]
MDTSPVPVTREATVRARRASMASAVGSLVEWYDFGLYGAAATLIFKDYFFGTDDPFVGLMASFATFAVGYFARPFGGMVFGHLGDRIGRKPVMVVTLALMGISTALIGVLPGHDSVGFLAPLLLVVLRLAQGLGAGAEYAGAVVLSSESAPPSRRGFYASWSGAGVWIGSALGLSVFQGVLALTGDDFYTWGWRLPFLLSLLLLAVSFYIRRKVAETDSFEAVKESEEAPKVPLAQLLRTEKRRLLVALGSNVILSGYSYIPQVWILSYLTDNVGLAAGLALAVNAVVLVSGALFMPFFGALGDRIGRRRLFLYGTAFGIAWPFPMFALIDTHRTPLIIAALVICFVCSVAVCYAAQAAFLPEMFPPALRYSGVAFARETSGAILAGTTPLVATALYRAADSWWPIAVCMVVYAFIALVSVHYSKFFRSDARQGDDAAFASEDTWNSSDPGGAAPTAKAVV